MRVLLLHNRYRTAGGEERSVALQAAAFEHAGVPHTLETYPAGHGFAVPDNPTHDAASEARHWDALADLYGSALAR